MRIRGPPRASVLLERRDDGWFHCGTTHAMNGGKMGPKVQKPCKCITNHSIPFHPRVWCVCVRAWCVRWMVEAHPPCTQHRWMPCCCCCCCFIHPDGPFHASCLLRKEARKDTLTIPCTVPRLDRLDQRTGQWTRRYAPMEGWGRSCATGRVVETTYGSHC